MTAKDYLEQHEIDDITLKVRFKDDRKWGEFTLSELMNQYALHIAEQSEKKLRIESRNEPKDVYTMGYLDGVSDMVSRITTLTK